ncbi:MAG TPA: endolytic transglycosylase MltG [Stellaceae bacterium]|nr:endolytic transglycosylase MltG [Stellaceae bacterium]
MLAFLRMLVGCFVTALAIVGVVAGVGYWTYRDVNDPGPLQMAQTVVIPPHTGISGITDLLADDGVIRHKLPFKVAAEIAGRVGGLKAGEYEFPAGASAVEVIEIIASGKTVKHRLTIPEGLTSPEIVALIDAAPLLTGDAGATPPEGSLLPETYVYSRDDTRQSIIARMQQASQETLAAAWAERRGDLPLTSPQEALTLASLVEKEASRNEERAHIAAVFLNRLRLGMKLQSDPTVRFVLGGNGASKFEGPLTHADLEVNSPYNTYAAKGLPPGPICNPGKAALLDALHPEQSDDLYFVADGNGGHVFAKTLADHNHNVVTYLHGATAAEAEPAPANPPQTAGNQQHCRVSPGHPCVLR